MCVSIVLIGGIMTWNEGLGRLEPTSQKYIKVILLGKNPLLLFRLRANIGSPPT
jgi:hypothetical protein